MEGGPTRLKKNKNKLKILQCNKRGISLTHNVSCRDIHSKLGQLSDNSDVALSSCTNQRRLTNLPKANKKLSI